MQHFIRNFGILRVKLFDNKRTSKWIFEGFNRVTEELWSYEFTFSGVHNVIFWKSWIFSQPAVFLDKQSHLWSLSKKVKYQTTFTDPYYYRYAFKKRSYDTYQITYKKMQYLDSCMFLQITTWFETIGEDLSLFSKQ